MDSSLGSHVRKRKMGKDPYNSELVTSAETNSTNRQKMGSGGNDLSKNETAADRNSTPIRSDKLDNRSVFQETSLTRPLLSGSDSETEIYEGVTIISTPEVQSPLEDEKSWQIGIQVFIPYMIAGFGMVAAGLVLDHVQVITHRSFSLIRYLLHTYHYRVSNNRGNHFFLSGNQRLTPGCPTGQSTVLL